MKHFFAGFTVVLFSSFPFLAFADNATFLFDPPFSGGTTDLSSQFFTSGSDAANYAVWQYLPDGSFSGQVCIDALLCPASVYTIATPLINGDYNFVHGFNILNGSGCGSGFDLSTCLFSNDSVHRFIYSYDTSRLPDATVNFPYSQTLRAGGALPYIWIISSGALPPGLSMNSAGTISGTPVTAGTFTFIAQSNDANIQVATSSHTIVVYPALVITTSVLPEGTVSIPYSQGISVSGFPVSWSIVAGTLPLGLSLNSRVGQITGIPSANGATSFVVEVKNPTGATTSQSYTLHINKVIVISTNKLSNGKVGSGYSKAFHANGGTAPLTWGIAGGALPPGLKLDRAGNLTGTPTIATTTSFSILVQDTNGNADTDNFSLSIKP